MPPKSILTRADYETYLIRLYFGATSDALQLCLDRAYLDFCRTMHGLKSIETRPMLYHQACGQIKEALKEILAREVVTQVLFDDWHQQTCNNLIALYSQHRHRMYIGQAQKWINMAFKYIFTFGESRLPGFSKLYPFCHVPLDNIFIEYLAPYHAPRLSVAWSRLTEYDEYLHFQQWVRTSFASIPLDTEFRLWLGKAPLILDKQ